MEREIEPEIKAMSDMASALSALDQDQIRRVLKWANDRYLGSTTTGTSDSREEQTRQAPLSTNFSELTELVDAARPSTGLERILVTAYWFQVAKGHGDFDSQSLNTELKHMGYPSGNITRDLDSLMDRTPRLIIQTRKEGTSKQARKRFRLTREGIRTVDNMLGTSTSNEQ